MVSNEDDSLSVCYNSVSQLNLPSSCCNNRFPLAVCSNSWMLDCEVEKPLKHQEQIPVGGLKSSLIVPLMMNYEFLVLNTQTVG